MGMKKRIENRSMHIEQADSEMAYLVSAFRPFYSHLTFGHRQLGVVISLRRGYGIVFTVRSEGKKRVVLVLEESST